MHTHFIICLILFSTTFLFAYFILFYSFFSFHYIWPCFWVMGSLKVISYNVKGLHSPIKRKKIINQLKRNSCQIAFLQETHLSNKEHKKLKKSWADKVFYSSNSCGWKRGVSILIHRQVNFTSTKIHKDSAGRFIMVNGLINGVEVCLLNIYSTNKQGWA